MADWYGAARTNYVKVRDYNALCAFLAGVPVVANPHPTAENFVMFSPEDDGFGGFNYLIITEYGDDVEWYWTDLVEHLAEGQVLVVMESGAEKLRYLTGHASAFFWDGREVSVNIDSIYLKAAQEFGVPLDSIAQATYTSLPYAAM